MFFLAVLVSFLTLLRTLEYSFLILFASAYLPCFLSPFSFRDSLSFCFIKSLTSLGRGTLNHLFFFVVEVIVNGKDKNA